MKITKFTTFYKIELDEKNLNREKFYCEDLKDSLSTINYHTEEKEPFCYDERGNIIRVPRGLGDEFLKNKLKVEGTIHDGVVFPYDSKKYFNINKKPYEEQMKVIQLSLKNFKRGATQTIIDMPTGRGKTFTATAIASELGCNVMILVKTHILLSQWAGLDGSFAKHTKLKMKYVYPMAGTKYFYHTYDNSHGMDYKIFVTTHATLRTIMKEKGSKWVAEWFIKNRIGCKIFDEFDIEVDSMLTLDFITSCRYNIYLSATTFKNGKFDDLAFQRMIRDIEKYGKEFYVDKPNRKAYIYGYTSNPEREERGQCYNYKGQFVTDKHMALTIQKKSYFDILDRVMRAHAIPIHNLDKGLKTVILTGKIENCKIVKEHIMKTFNITERDISEFHSEMSKADKEIALKKPFIVSITDSIGRGLDINKIKLTIDLETYAGGSIFKQATGRNGRVGGEEGIYVKVVDKSFAEPIRYYYKLKSFFEEEFKSYKLIDIKNED